MKIFQQQFLGFVGSNFLEGRNLKSLVALLSDVGSVKQFMNRSIFLM